MGAESDARGCLALENKEIKCLVKTTSKLALYLLQCKYTVYSPNAFNVKSTPPKTCLWFRGGLSPEHVGHTCICKNTVN